MEKQATYLLRIWQRPVMASLLDPVFARFAALLAVVQVGFMLMGWPLWPCPVETVLGFPCPGCGLTRALVALLRGQWSMAWHQHPFAYVAALGMAVMMLAAVLPDSKRLPFQRVVAAIERKTALGAWLLLALMTWWPLRLMGWI